MFTCPEIVQDSEHDWNAERRPAPQARVSVVHIEAWSGSQSEIDVLKASNKIEAEPYPSAGRRLCWSSDRALPLAGLFTD